MLMCLSNKSMSLQTPSFLSCLLHWCQKNIFSFLVWEYVTWYTDLHKIRYTEINTFKCYVAAILANPDCLRWTWMFSESKSKNCTVLIIKWTYIISFVDIRLLNNLKVQSDEHDYNDLLFKRKHLPSWLQKTKT